MSWEAEWTERALRDADRLDRRMRERVFAAIEQFGETERGDLRKLRGQEATWRLRVGAVRVFLEFVPAVNRVRVMQVLPRGRAYRR